MKQDNYYVQNDEYPVWNKLANELVDNVICNEKSNAYYHRYSENAPFAAIGGIVRSFERLDGAFSFFQKKIERERPGPIQYEGWNDKETQRGNEGNKHDAT